MEESSTEDKSWKWFFSFKIIYSFYSWEIVWQSDGQEPELRGLGGDNYSVSGTVNNKRNWGSFISQKMTLKKEGRVNSVKFTWDIKWYIDYSTNASFKGKE